MNAEEILYRLMVFISDILDEYPVEDRLEMAEKLLKRIEEYQDKML